MTDTSNHTNLNTLKSIQGLTVNILYAPQIINQGEATLYQVNSVTFSLQGNLPTYKADSKITLVLINQYFQNGIYEQQSVWQVDCTSADFYMSMNAYTGQINQPVDLFQNLGHGTTITCKPQIAIVVDGIWQGDPMQNGAHNFNFAWEFGNLLTARR